MNQCPECGKKLIDFAVECPRCHWSLVGNDRFPAGSPLARSADGMLATATQSSDPQHQSEIMIELPATDRHDVEDDHYPPSQSDLQIHKAKELIAEEDFSRALAYLNRAVTDAPLEQLPECFSLRGYVYYRQGLFDRAEQECSAAIDRNWEDANTYAWRAASRGEQNRWRDAFDDLQLACKYAGDQLDEFLQLMESYAAAARAYFQQLVQNGEDSADLFFERGWVYYRCSQLAKAERDFKQALTRSADHAWAALGLALVHHQAGIDQYFDKLIPIALQGDRKCQRLALRARAQHRFAAADLAGANRDLNSLWKLAAGDHQQMVEACRLRSELGDHIRAIDWLTAVTDRFPDEHFVWLVRGDCYRAIKNYSHAIKDYTRFLRFFPQHVDGLVKRADAQLAMKRYPAAHRDLDHAIELDPHHYQARLIRTRLLLLEEHFDAALTECEQVVKLDNDAEGFAVKARIYQRLCDYSAAIEEYSRAIEMTHGDKQRAAEYLYLRGAIHYELEDFQSAFSDFQASCNLRPNHSGGWVWKAATASRLEKWSSAIVALEQAIAARPAASAPYQKLGQPVANRAIEFYNHQQQRGQACPETFRHRGMANQFLGNHQAAIADFSGALKQQPGDIATRIRRGRSLAALGNHKQAGQDFTTVIQAQPDHHVARYNRAISRTATGQHDRARSDLKKAIRVAPEHPRYHLLLSELYQQQGQTAKVIRALDKAVSQDPTDPLTYRRRAIIHAAAGNYREAIRDDTHAIELDPGQFEALVHRGHTYLKSEQPSLAIEDFELALTHRPTLARAYSGRATVLLAEGRLDYSLIWLTKAIHRFSDPRDLSEILFARGKVFVQMGRLAPAISDFSAVIDLMRDDPATLVAVRQARALTNLQAGRLEKAAKDYRRILTLKPDHAGAQRILSWLENPEAPRPEMLPQAQTVKRPTRPPVVRAGIELTEDSMKAWQNEVPFDTWIIRAQDKKEYGPVHFNILTSWIAEGRIDLGMKLLRADWSKWKRAEKIFPEILPFHSSNGFVTDFPGINVG